MEVSVNEKNFNLIEKELLCNIITTILNNNKNANIRKQKRMKIILNDLKNNSNVSSLFDFAVEVFDWHYEINFLPQPKWFIEKIQNYFILHPEKLQLLNISQMIDFGWEIKDIVGEAIALSEKTISGYYATTDDVSRWSELRKKNAKYFIVALFCGLIKGHIGAVRLSEEEYRLALAGKLSEDSIAGSGLECKYFYISAIVIEPSFRNKRILQKMILKLKDIIERERQHKSLRSILANTYTRDGERLCELYGFQKITKNIDGGTIYELLLA